MTRIRMRPMLAANADLEQLRYPVLASPKYDGIRCLIINGRAVSRKLEPIPNRYIQEQLSKRRYEGLDGELVVGSTFQEATSGVMSIEGEPDFTFRVFDMWNEPDLIFWRRLLRAERICRAVRGSAEIVDHVTVGTEKLVRTLEKAALREGREGLVLRAPDGLYKYGRSTVKEGGMLRLTQTVTGEAVVLSVIELRHNNNAATRSKLGTIKRSSAAAGKVAGGVAGALRVRDCRTGIEFEVAAGLTAAQRAAYWAAPPLGELIKYSYKPYGVKEKPRQPVFLGLRDRRDID